jgi:hypothetical protein
MKGAELDLTSAVSGECELELRGSRHKCRIDNIDAGGAWLHCLGFLQESVLGDQALLHLGTNMPAIDCRIKEIAAARIELRFDE